MNITDSLSDKSKYKKSNNLSNWKKLKISFIYLYSRSYELLKIDAYSVWKKTSQKDFFYSYDLKNSQLIKSEDLLNTVLKQTTYSTKTVVQKTIISHHIWYS